MPARPRALIIGGSVGGLFAASLLRQIGWDVAVFERAQDDLAGRGAGIGTTGDLFTVMRRIGARISPSTGVVLRDVRWIDRSGAILCTVPRGWVTGAWGRIYRPVRDVVPSEIYHPGRTLARVEQDGSKVSAIFTDGSHETGDLLIAADGVHSTVRRQFLPEVAARYAGYVAWRGMVEERDIPPAAHELLFGGIAHSYPDGEMTLSAPIPGAQDDIRPGHRRYYYIWYRPAHPERDLPDLVTDEEGRHHGMAIPPPLIRRAHIATLKAQARDLLPSALADVVAGTAQPLLQPITDLEVPRMVFGRAVLLGDAAFIARPHVAAGITKAALEAAALADALSASPSDIDAALAEYDRDRSAFGRALVDYSRYLGAYLAGQIKPPAERSGDELALDPERHMREYGAPHLLRDATEADIIPT